MKSKVFTLVLISLMLPLCFFSLSVPASAATGNNILQVWNRDGTVLYDELVLPDGTISSMTIHLVNNGFEVYSVANGSSHSSTFDYKYNSEFAGFSTTIITKKPSYVVGQTYVGRPIYVVYVYSNLDVFYADTGSADGMLGELGQLARPDVDFNKPNTSAPDIMGALDSDALALYMSGFSSFMNNEYMLPILFIAIGFVFVSYVLFGKGSG